MRRRECTGKVVRKTAWLEAIRMQRSSLDIRLQGVVQDLISPGIKVD
jgi:hypothetical protein